MIFITFESLLIINDYDDNALFIHEDPRQKATCFVDNGSFQQVYYNLCNSAKTNQKEGVMQKFGKITNYKIYETFKKHFEIHHVGESCSLRCNYIEQNWVRNNISFFTSRLGTIFNLPIFHSRIVSKHLCYKINERFGHFTLKFMCFHPWHRVVSFLIIHESCVSFHDHGMIFGMALTVKKRFQSRI